MSEELSAVIEALVLAQSHLDAFKSEMPEEYSNVIAKIEFGLDWTACRIKALQKHASKLPMTVPIAHGPHRLRQVIHRVDGK